MKEEYESRIQDAIDSIKVTVRQAPPLQTELFLLMLEDFAQRFRNTLVARLESIK